MQHGEALFTDPIIVIGMHRSGTSLLVRMLDQMGVFVGRDLDEEHHESKFFIELNNWVLQTAGAHWDNPAPLKYLIARPDIREVLPEYLNLSLRSPRANRFFGWERHLQFRRSKGLQHPWGWKDPRNTFTLPLWMDMFPNARVVHIHRHGVDVARSLQAAWNPPVELIRQVRKMFNRRRILYNFRPIRSGFTFNSRTATLDGCFTLWEEYTRQGRAHVEALGSQALDIGYEDLLADPVTHLDRVASFCSVPVTEAEIAKVAAQSNPQRAYAFRHDPELRSFANQVAHRLQKLGYEASDEPRQRNKRIDHSSRQA